MKCSGCGAEIPEGSLYCDNCGKEVNIVPDFEPELDFNLEESIGSIKADFFDEEEPGMVSSTGKKRSVFLLCACFLLTLLLSVAGIKVWQNHSYEFQLQRADACFSKNDYIGAEKHYRRAISLDGTDINVHLALADVCLQKGNKLEYEYILRDVIQSKLCTQEQLEYTYGKLIEIYSARGEYDVINEILLASGDARIQNAYQVYLAGVPEFNYESGEYTKSIPLKLTSPTTGSIYYTIDGSEPDEESLLYTSPILLDKDVVVKAVVVNEFGVHSDVVSNEYQFQITIESEPVILTVSGEYTVPTMILAQQQYGKELYYTTDGTDPNYQSRIYTEPIPMPLGESTYSFSYLNQDGTCGKIARRTYQLTLDAEISVEEAEALIVEYMLMLKKIYKEDGTFRDDTSAKYLYQYQHVIHLEDVGDFYVIAEVYKDESGDRSKTGSYYVVSIHKKEAYKLLTDESNNQTLVDILIDYPDEG